MTASEAPLSVRRIPDPREPVPAVAVPTLVLMVVGLSGWIASTAGYVTGALPWFATVALNALTGYLLFTVAHDAGHRSAAGTPWLNELMGRLSVPIFALHAAFPVWRFIHMQHHRFTNHDDGADPDHWTMAGPAWQRPLRWLTIDYAYVAFYLRHVRSRKSAERVEAVAAILVAIVVPVALIATGNTVMWLAVLFVPSRLAVLYLAWAFDYLPHNRLHHTPSEDRLKTTRNRLGAERLLSPILLYQNYHLVHHLHPVVPFYRYLAVWRRNEATYLEGEPALSTVGGRDLTPEEYRRIRKLVHEQ